MRTRLGALTFVTDRAAYKSFRSDMDAVSSFGKYEISERGKERIESLRQLLQDNPRADEDYPLWVYLAEKLEEVDEKIEIDSEGSEENEQEAEETDTPSEFTSTQFYFTQPHRIEPNKTNGHATVQMSDVVESIYEELQRTNGKLETIYFENLCDEDLENVANTLANKLCSKGFYNLCRSVLNMNVEDRVMYMNTICSQILLPKIVNTEEPSRLMCSAVGECAEKFPDDIQKFIFVPMLNTELKDVTILSTIINACDSHRKTLLLTEFLIVVKELKPWHISILQLLLCTETDESVNDRLIELFSQKAPCYSTDKNFGKLILSFLKLNTNLSEDQVDLLWEVAAVNETIFKGAMQNILETMYD